MLGVLLDVIVADDVFKELEGVIVLIVYAWCIVENTNVGVVHLVITHHEKRGSIDTLVAVGSGTAL